MDAVSGVLGKVYWSHNMVWRRIMEEKKKGKKKAWGKNQSVASLSGIQDWSEASSFGGAK